ncbi:metallophosphoesterase [Trinickia caryophylli]|uniref:Calcineurin-like phosphoesterase n=1 Tax=Trinickia caryophylli TaxID=28094 RepID=A0A1X7CMR7_TRICW|nr:metallophosphoesterase [Trinickia caryophylli]PMS11231.1 metallophosphoesterase [Trinickia caryophylli]TRX20086.1 metallophosphoesterase [Trinickia caryophylli]WQE12564.1 metallophosphoesterase [Trinickia caryophylli]SME99651.1 Calcineurin-like phosphoesterase [Trinickia caryophylli]GLU30254.1 calcineurin-like phosphoesterase [Trinickia caryophylli]
MKIRILSDLHLECDEPEAIPHADADLVVLAGDIHNHAEGLRWAAETFDTHTPVIYVPGNHEYYDGEFGALEAAMRDAAASVENVHYLNHDALVDPDGHWRVLGATLWTDFELFGADPASFEQSVAAAEKVMVDFRGPIQVASWSGSPQASGAGAPRTFTVADSLALHRRARAWLETELAKPFSGKTIVVTHHAPHRDSLAARYANDPASAGFISHLPSLVGPPVALWIHGHTHTAFDYVANGTRVVCNPRGYVSRRSGRLENEQFAWDRIVEV